MLAALATPCRIKQSHRRRRRVASGRAVYGYVGGNPLSFNDPSGLAACQCAGNGMPDHIHVDSGVGLDLLDDAGLPFPNGAVQFHYQLQDANNKPVGGWSLQEHLGPHSPDARTSEHNWTAMTPDGWLIPGDLVGPKPGHYYEDLYITQTFSVNKGDVTCKLKTTLFHKMTYDKKTGVATSNNTYYVNGDGSMTFAAGADSDDW
jgi:hypothetical protein